ncbi:MAG: hypothetical protein NWR73_08810 [Flavobacteriales bacterium]|nr:hypothetical protein [Flavobacteriales bacterium]
MTKHNDPFFEMFRKGLANHEVAPSGASWDAIRSQTTRGGFWRFAWNSLNIFYVVAAAGLLSAIAMTSFPGSSPSARILRDTEEAIELSRAVAVFAESNATENVVATSIVSTTAKRNQPVGYEPQVRTEPSIIVSGGGSMLEPVVVTQESILAETSIPTEELYVPVFNPHQEVSSDLSNLKDALKADGDKMYLKIPVKVTVEDK